MAVVSFNHYKYLREIVLMDKPCDRPFHIDEYVLKMSDKRCERCNVPVQLTNHPSLGGAERWYG